MGMKIFDMFCLVLSSMCVGAAIVNHAYWWAALGLVLAANFATGFLLNFYEENPND